MLTGTMHAGGKTVPLEGKVHGEDITFTAGGKEYHAHVKGKQLVLQ